MFVLCEVLDCFERQKEQKFLQAAVRSRLKASGLKEFMSLMHLQNFLDKLHSVLAENRVQSESLVFL